VVVYVDLLAVVKEALTLQMNLGVLAMDLTRRSNFPLWASRQNRNR